MNQTKTLTPPREPRYRGDRVLGVPDQRTRPAVEVYRQVVAAIRQALDVIQNLEHDPHDSPLARWRGLDRASRKKPTHPVTATLKEAHP